MSTLTEKRCVPCDGGTPALSDVEIRQLLGQVHGWKLAQPTGMSARIEKSFTFEGFMPGVDFVNEVARVAEDEGHHPDLMLRWGEVRVRLWTHAARGLTENDFILAAKIDRLRA